MTSPPVMYSPMLIVWLINVGLTSMVSNCFDHCCSSTVSDSKPFPGNSSEEGSSLSRAIQSNVSDYAVLLRFEFRAFRGENDDLNTSHGDMHVNYLSTGESFSNIIISISFQSNSDTLGKERAETLASSTN